jgi:uncharacterized membrane protein (UPF0127 family)
VRSPRPLSPLLLLLILPSLAACGGSSSTSSSRTATPDARTPLQIITKSGQRVELRIEEATTPQQRTTGLSGRKTLDPDGGMLFDIPVRGGGFSMKDTSIPLSVAFLGTCGEIVDIADMQPNAEGLTNTQLTYRFGLEVNQGWFARHNVAVGDRVRLPTDLNPPNC